MAKFQVLHPTGLAVNPNVQNGLKQLSSGHASAFRNSLPNLKSLGFRGAHKIEYSFFSALDLLSAPRRFSVLESRARV